jgi:hypothetical protein
VIASMSTPPACRAPDVMAEMRAATGGDAWNRIAETTAFGHATIFDLRGSARIDNDLGAGRYAQHFDVAGMGSTAEVYDGSTIWAQDISGGVHPYDTPFARARAITNAYLIRHAYFDARTDATFACRETRSDTGKSVIVIRVQPRGGIPADLAIDARTHLLESVSEQLPLDSADGITRFADYRTIDGVVLPFSISRGTEKAPADGYVLSVTRYRVQPHANDLNYAKPSVPDNAKMIGRARSSRVPMLLEGRQLIVFASIDGHAPMPFILDTGGHAILTTQAAKSLGLQGRGAGQSGGSGAGTISTQYTRVASLRIGDAQLLDQSFLVIPYPYSFYERGKKAPLAGILGLEVFERFAVRLDYGNRLITFTPLAAYRHEGSGATVQLRFEDQEDMPVVNAAADGHTGLFGTDTGNAGILILFGDFLKRTGLLDAYVRGVKTIGQGTGGTTAGRKETLQRFTIGGHEMDAVPSNFTQMTSGSFSAHTEAGNLGFSILSRFVPTFDYLDETLYLDPELRATPFGVNRSGLHFEKNAPEGYDVSLVDPGSPAASAGIATGDRIVAINGHDASNYSWADLVAMCGKPAGTKLLLRVQNKKAVRDVSMILR